MYNIIVGDLECLHDRDHGLPLTDGLLILGLIFVAFPYLLTFLAS